MQKTNNISKLIANRNELVKTLSLNLDRYSRFVPMFAQAPFTEIEDNQIVIQYYPDGAEIEPPYHWFLISDIAIRFENVVSWGSDITPSPLKIFRLADVPPHISDINHAVKRFFKGRLVFVDDRLPSLLMVTVDLEFNLKKQRKAILGTIVRWLVRDSGTGIKKRVDKVIEDSKIPFKKSLDEILRLAGISSEKSFSYCLACGNAVLKSKFFCDSKKTGRYKNKDNCRNKFRYWLKGRLNISDLGQQTKKRKELRKKLQELISLFPLSAFELLQEKYSALYTSKYKTQGN